MEVASGRSPIYRRSASRAMTSSMDSISGMQCHNVAYPAGRDSNSDSGRRKGTVPERAGTVPQKSSPLGRRLLDGPAGQHPRQVLFVVATGAQVGGRVEPVGGVLRGL